MTLALNKNKFLDRLWKCVPYLFIVLMSFLSGYTLFYKGLPSGDDTWFHLTQIEDLYLGFTRGFWGLSSNHTLFGIFALDNYGFYGPLSHYSAAILMFIFPGCTAIIAYKIVLFASFILGGVYTYLFSKKISSNTAISLIGALLFTLLPYRMFSALARQAFSETVAFSFVPMIFYGIYRVLHDERFYILPYITLILGAMAVVLSHPFTALMTATIGVLYLIFNYKLIFKQRHGYNVFTMLLLSGVFVLGGLLFYILLAHDTTSSGVFRFCDPVLAWTDLNHVQHSINNSIQYTGFLNFEWIQDRINDGTFISGTILSIALGPVYFLCSIALLCIVDLLVKKLPKNQYYRYILDLLSILIFPLISLERAEVWIAVIFAYIFFIIACISKDINSEKGQEESKRFSLKAYNKPDFYFLIISLVITLVMIFSKNAWNYIPSIYRQCQFAWRIWGTFSFLLTWFVVFLLTPLKDKKAPVFAVGLLACSLFPLSHGILEKRAYYEYNKEPLWDVMDEKFLIEQCTWSGALNEMVPGVFYDDTYVSEYENSLYSNIKYRVRHRRDFVFTLEDYITPGILKGEVSNIKITKLNTPDTEFDLTITKSDVLIQLPTFYQNGYYATFINEETNSEETIKGINVDGLIAFSFDKIGTYKMKVDFKRCEAYQIFRPLFYMSLIGLIPLGIWGYKFRKELEKLEAK